ncbi:hypothetical protein ACN082_09985 [Rothia sp. CCM 9417]|uniref:hypothetical protein n=1 Tax=Rothia sp. CCM 9417 TaxID=3402657 RepID=UPI003ADE3588
MSFTKGNVNAYTMGNSARSYIDTKKGEMLADLLYKLHTNQPVHPPIPYEEESPKPNSFLHPFKASKWDIKRARREAKIKTFNQTFGQLVQDLNNGVITREAAIQYLESQVPRYR